MCVSERGMRRRSADIILGSKPHLIKRSSSKGANIMLLIWVLDDVFVKEVLNKDDDFLWICNINITTDRV